MIRGFKRLSVGTTVITLVLVTIGAVVRVTKSGLGCGTDWPHCHGRLIPSLERAAVAIEYSHRITAAFVGLLVLSLAIFAWLKLRNVGTIFWPSLAALVVVITQGWIGRNVVTFELREVDVVIHFMTAMTLLGLLTLISVNTFWPRGGRASASSRWALGNVVLTVAALFLGALVSQFDAARAFPDWPLMGGALLPDLAEHERLFHFLHRSSTLLLGASLVAFAIAVSRREPRDRILTASAHAAASIWTVQVVVGALNVFTGSSPWAVVLHVFLGASLWMLVIIQAAVAYRRSPAMVVGQPEGSEAVTTSSPPITERIKAYILLTKPRIVELLLITTVPAMLLAGSRSWWQVAATLIGGTLAAGSANSINCFIDRDIDVAMERTRDRPLPAHRVSPSSALVFGVLLGIVGFIWLAVFVNLLAAALATGAILFYVFIYTLWMKRTTPSNIVIGGAAGAAPVLVGWAAVTGTVEPPAWVLFAIVFYWTPPHFWALAMRYTDDYARAGVPMLPVVRGPSETARHIFLYSVVLLGVSLLMAPVADLGWFYLGASVLLGAAFLGYAVKLRKSPNARTGMALFHFSLAYLVLLFVAMTVDGLTGTPLPGIVSQGVFATGAALFLAAEGVILARAIGFRRAAEIVWTAVPLVVTAASLLIAWQTGVVASP